VSRPAALALVLGAALAARLWVLATHTYIVFPDETFQYLEPAHRLAFGSGVTTWEYLDGIRNWLLPGVLALVMRAASLVTDGPDGYLVPIRLLCALASLAVPYAGFRLVEQRFGTAAGLLAGLLSGLATETVYFADTVMTEPLATDAALLAIWLGGSAPSRRRRLLAGVLFGLAATLRFQYAPVLALLALWQHARRWRDLADIGCGGLAVVLPALGVLDWLTWGAPFQSVWLNFLRNATEGVSGAMGTQAWYFYGAYYLVAWGPLAIVLLALAVYGGLRLPVLGLAALATIALHSLTPHKELRFVFLATACLPMLVGVGLGALLQRLPRPRRPQPRAAMAVALALALAVETGVATLAQATPGDAWHRDRSMLAAVAAARAVPGVCGLGVRTIWVYRSGGYVYWHRDLPIYFETWEAAQHLEASTFRLRLASELDGRPVEQYPGPALAAHSAAFNALIGTPGDGLPGFARTACFGAGGADDSSYCVFVRPGGCG
jgi:GPI mannosyltransferase 3